MYFIISGSHLGSRQSLSKWTAYERVMPTLMTVLTIDKKDDRWTSKHSRTIPSDCCSARRTAQFAFRPHGVVASMFVARNYVLTSIMTRNLCMYSTSVVNSSHTASWWSRCRLSSVPCERTISVQVDSRANWRRSWSARGDMIRWSSPPHPDDGGAEIDAFPTVDGQLTVEAFLGSPPVV